MRPGEGVRHRNRHTADLVEPHTLSEDQKANVFGGTYSMTMQSILSAESISWLVRMFRWFRARGGSRLLDKTAAVFVGHPVGRQDLDGHVAVEAGIAGAVDLAHAYCAQERAYLVGPELGSREERHGRRLRADSSRGAQLVTRKRDALSKTLAGHDDVDAMWYFGGLAGVKLVEAASAGNMKRTWTSQGERIEWLDPVHGEGPEFLREATQVKNIWTPSGE